MHLPLQSDSWLDNLRNLRQYTVVNSLKSLFMLHFVDDMFYVTCNAPIWEETKILTDEKHKIVMYLCTHIQVSIVQEVNMNVIPVFFLKNILV